MSELGDLIDPGAEYDVLYLVIEVDNFGRGRVLYYGSRAPAGISYETYDLRKYDVMCSVNNRSLPVSKRSRNKVSD